jgi:hypothetical protein
VNYDRPHWYGLLHRLSQWALRELCIPDGTRATGLRAPTFWEAVTGTLPPTSSAERHP